MDFFVQLAAQHDSVGSGLFSASCWGIVAVVLGAFIGSFLNVVIYRVPRGMSVNKPARSFCPGCEKQIPWYRNIPVVTWLLQRGRCAGCKATIPVRYLLVEVLTAILFGAVWWFYAGPEMFLGWVLVALLVAISFIDGEHYIIPVNWCWVAIIIAVLASYVFANLHFPGDLQRNGGLLGAVIQDKEIAFKWAGVISSFMGFVFGYLVLVAVVLLGKIAFGKRKISCEQSEQWSLKEPETELDQLQFILGDESLDWGEVFYRKADRIELQGANFLVDGKPVKGESLTIWERQVCIGDRKFDIEKIESLSGEATKVVIPREAMGAGDPPFLGMIGAFLGPLAVIFTLCASCLYALIAAILGRVGYGKPLPFGPFLALGALTWMFGGYRLMLWYLNWVLV